MSKICKVICGACRREFDPISVTPELLEALHKIKQKVVLSLVGSQREAEIYQIAEQAIAKAEGISSPR